MNWILRGKGKCRLCSLALFIEFSVEHHLLVDCVAHYAHCVQVAKSTAIPNSLSEPFYPLPCCISIKYIQNVTLNIRKATIRLKVPSSTDDILPFPLRYPLSNVYASYYSYIPLTFFSYFLLNPSLLSFIWLS